MGAWAISEEPELYGYTVEWAEPGFFLLSRRNRLYRSESLEPPFVELGEFPAPLWKRTAARVRLAQRALRFMFYNALRLPDGSLFLTFGRDVGIYSDGQFRRLDGLDRPFRVLRAACALDGDGRVFFGEYLPNTQRGPMHVYQYTPGERHAEIVHRFPEGSIRHIHGVYYDPYERCLWCATGDRSSECRILRTADSFKTLETVGAGDETWRCVSLRFSKDAVFYGMDAEFQQNYLYRIDRATGRRETLTELEGPVYYSYSVGEDLFFAVSAELCPSQQGTFAALWHVAPDGECTRLLTQEKDRLPVHYFMPGTLHFPQGPGVRGYVPFHMVALRGGDNRSFALRRSAPGAHGGTTPAARV